MLKRRDFVAGCVAVAAPELELKFLSGALTVFLKLADSSCSELRDICANRSGAPSTPKRGVGSCLCNSRFCNPPGAGFPWFSAARRFSFLSETQRNFADRRSKRDGHDCNYSINAGGHLSGPIDGWCRPATDSRKIDCATGPLRSHTTSSGGANACARGNPKGRCCLRSWFG